jgi:hypothetical protein
MRAHKESLEKQIQNSKNKNHPMAQHEYMLNKKIIESIEVGSSTTGTVTRKPF